MPIGKMVLSGYSSLDDFVKRASPKAAASALWVQQTLEVMLIREGLHFNPVLTSDYPFSVNYTKQGDQTDAERLAASVEAVTKQPMKPAMTTSLTPYVVSSRRIPGSPNNNYVMVRYFSNRNMVTLSVVS